jgi:hypothetical protein
MAEIFSNYITWIKTHERLFIITIGAFILFHFMNKAYDAYALHEGSLSSSKAQVVQTDDTANKTLSRQLTAMQIQLGQESIQINKAMQQRDIQVQQQKTVDNASTPSQLAMRIQTVLGVTANDVIAMPTGVLTFSQAAAHADADALEDNIKAQADVVDLKKLLGNEQTLSGKQTDLLTGVRKELDDEKASHTQDVKTLNAKAKSSWLHGFKWGLITGVVGTEVIRVAIGRP